MVAVCYPKYIAPTRTFTALCDLFGVDPGRVYEIRIDSKDDDLDDDDLDEVPSDWQRPTVAINDCEERPINAAQLAKLYKMHIL